MKKVLLTTVFRPYSEQYSKYNQSGDEEWFDYLYSRLTREPGPFAMSSYPTGTSLQLIAANIPADVTVLLHPSLDEYKAELQKGYNYIGISFLIKGVGKLFPMIASARKYAPEAKVIIGGFGTMLHKLTNSGADFVCRGEGISFFRSLLGVKGNSPPAGGWRQPLVTADATLKLFRDYPYLPRYRYAQLTHGFGCPHKCEFCTTSSYFGYKHIPFCVGKDLYAAMDDVYSKTEIGYFLIYEEDLCLYRNSVKEWGGLIESDPRSFSWACFSTVKSLSRWDLEQLVAMGFSNVWIGVESINSPFAKTEGRDMARLFEELKELGVTTTGSMIFGLDHHTPENLQDEVDYLIKLAPTSTQVGTLMPSEGTKLRDRLEQAGRLRAATYKEADLYSEVVIHPEFEPGQLRNAVFDAYDQLYSSATPAIHRAARTWLDGHFRFRRSRIPALQRRAEKYGQWARVVRPLFLSTLQFLPNEMTREAVRETLALMTEAFGAPTSQEESKGRFVARLFELERARAELFSREPIEPEPAILRLRNGVQIPLGPTAASVA